MAILRVRDAYGNVHDISCIKGKSAYEYAVDGGYSGTESEFAEKMAQEQLAGSTSDLTPTDVYNAISEGRTVWITHTDSNYGVMKFNFFLYSVVLPGVASVGIFEMNSVPISAQLLGNTNSNIWTLNVNFLAQQSDVPSKLPNPNALTITIGDTTVTYDGSVAKSIEIADGSEVSY